MAVFDRSVSWVTGPLACYAAGFAAELPARGWGSDSIYLHLRLMRELSAWMSAQGLGTGQLWRPATSVDSDHTRITGHRRNPDGDEVPEVRRRL